MPASCTRSGKPTALLAVCLTLIGTPHASAQISWNVTFDDVINTTGLGFDDPAQGATRRETFARVTEYVSSIFSDSATLDFSVRNSRNIGSGPLASAGTLYASDPSGFTNGLLSDHVLTGSDPAPGTRDGQATFDFGYNWNSGLSAPSASQFDLFSVTLHEITHAFGFATLADANGESLISHSTSGVFGVWDSYISLGNGTPLFSSENGATFTGSAADLTSGDVWFTGPYARAQNRGNPIPIHAPGTFAPGSSLSHIASTLPAVMNPSISAGQLRREYTNLDIAILQDLGYSLAPVPEPGIFLLLTLALLPALRRKR